MLAKYFFELPDQIKEEMQERILLKILKRLTKVHEGSRRESLQMSGKSGLKG